MWSLRLGVRVGLVILQQGGKSCFLAWGSSQGDHLLVSSITTSGGKCLGFPQPLLAWVVFGWIRAATS